MFQLLYIFRKNNLEKTVIQIIIRLILELIIFVKTVKTY